MSDKPSYLGLLNAIATAESHAAQYLQAWIEHTDDPDVRAVLQTVELREREHGVAFEKRINELGFELRPTDDPGFARQMEIVTSDRTDLEKLEALGLLQLRVEDGPDLFDNLFRDHTIDIQTGALLGRYIAEERDTLRRVAGCRDVLVCRAEEATPAREASSSVEDKVDALTRAVEELRQIVCAQAMPASGV